MDYLLNNIDENILTAKVLVLNLIINGLPSKLLVKINIGVNMKLVLNLIINGLPSKPLPKG